MNDPDPSPINLDELRFLPDWLREEGPAPAKQYASHDFPAEERPGRGDQRGGSFGGPRRDARRSGGGPPDRRRDGGNRPGLPARPGGGGRPFRDERGHVGAPQPAPVQVAPVAVEFLPDERCLGSINKQIRSTHLAYPLFGLARMFLQEPERHLVQFTLAPEAVAAGATLYQLGEDGPITLDKATLEKIAFEASKEQYYAEETVQKEPLKGNFVNVARDRQSGTLLGPTNHHGYQPALRSLYESRFSRRMSFEDFRRGVEVSTDPALIERWKEEARTTTSIRTREETPTALAGPAEARQHFRQHHLDGLVRAGTKLAVHGSVARQLPEAGMMQAIREAHDRELRYPAQFVQLLRQGLQNAGLHIFKHRKRIVYVSLARPTSFVAHGVVSDNVRAILETIASSPLCTRKALAERVLSKQTPPAAPALEPAPAPAPTESPLPAATVDVDPAPAGENDGGEPVGTPVEAAPATVAEDPLSKAKAALAADLRFLVQSGHIIEFHNGTFDLPLPPRPREDAPSGRPASRQKAPGGAKPTGVAEAPASLPGSTEEPSEPLEEEDVAGEEASAAAEMPPEAEIEAAVVRVPDAERDPGATHGEGVEKPDGLVVP